MTNSAIDAVLIDQHTAAALIGCSTKTIQRLSKSDPSFPAAIRPTGAKNFARYPRAAVLAWVESRAAAADRRRRFARPGPGVNP